MVSAGLGQIAPGSHPLFPAIFDSPTQFSTTILKKHTTNFRPARPIRIVEHILWYFLTCYTSGDFTVTNPYADCQLGKRLKT